MTIFLHAVLNRKAHFARTENQPCDSRRVTENKREMRSNPFIRTHNSQADVGGAVNVTNHTDTSLLLIFYMAESLRICFFFFVFW